MLVVAAAATAACGVAAAAAAELLEAATSGLVLVHSRFFGTFCSLTSTAAGCAISELADSSFVAEGGGGNGAGHPGEQCSQCDNWKLPDHGFPLVHSHHPPQCIQGLAHNVAARGCQCL